MAYGLSDDAYIENGPAQQLAKVNAQRSTARSWRVLTHACRMAVIEQALRAANDSIDEYPLAL